MSTTSDMERQDRVEKPWGYYAVVARVEDGRQVRVKHLHVEPGHRLSAQSHTKREEVWYIVSGRGMLELGTTPGVVERTVDLTPGVQVTIPVGTVHRAWVDAQEAAPLEVVEVWLGAEISEDDIVRYSDDYGRPQSGN